MNWTSAPRRSIHQNVNFPDFKNHPKLSPEDQEIVDSLDSKTKEMVRNYVESVEIELLKRLEIHLGRVPSNDELKQHGTCVIWPDGAREYQWKGETILKVAPIFKGITPPEHFS